MWPAESVFARNTLLRGPASVQELNKSEKAQLKRERRYRELEIGDDIQNELEELLTHGVSLCVVSISEVRRASDSDPDWSGNIDYF